MRIVALDEAGGATERDLPPGTQGMVLFKSPNLFSGFLDSADNVGVFTADGWLVTGDLGWLDEQGRLNLTGRSKDLIIRSGHNIDPQVIEDALAAHPAVQMCAAVGAPDAYAGELPVLFATLVPGASVSEAELLAFAGRRVDEAPAKPRSVTIIDRMPMTNVGKIYKPELRLMAARAVISALVADACREAGLPDAARPQVHADAQRQTVIVVLDVHALGGQADALHKQLRSTLARVPCKSELRRA
jgi:fatty-acyl-CoA synthase